MKLEEKLVLTTLKYHNFFSFPLTLQEISKYQIANFKINFKRLSRPISLKKLKAILLQLKAKKKIGCQKGLYFLCGQEQLIKLRKKRQQFSQRKIIIAQKIAKIFAFLPWVKAVAITGALAMKNCPKNDDIDFLVITAANRLWLTRIVLILFLLIIGKKRWPTSQNITNRICLNVFLDQSALEINKDKQSLFIAHEIVQAKPIINKNKTWEQFLNKNLWVLNYLPNSLKNLNFNLSDKKLKKDKLGFFSLLNALVFFFQYQYMKKKITNEKVAKNYAFFHPQDRSKTINSGILKIDD